MKIIFRLATNFFQKSRKPLSNKLNSMKIVQLVCTYPPYKGGMGSSALSLARALSDKHQLTTLTPKYGPDYISSLKTKYLKPILKLGNAALLPQVSKYLQKGEVVIFHYPFFGTDLILFLYKIIRSRKQKLIIHYHMDVFKLNFWSRLFKLPSRLIAPLLFRKADLITCFSLDYVRESQIKKYYLKNPSKFREIPYGLDTEKFYPSKKPGREKWVNLLFVGGLDKAHYFKGLGYLLEAISKISTPIVLNVVGQGDLKNHFQKKSRDLKINDRVNFLGSITGSGLPNTYRENDLLVLPSIDRSEAFGVVLLEALASGLPVITSDLPGVRTVFREGEEGLLVPPEDTEKLKEKIEYLSKRPELRQEMGEKGRLLVKKQQSRRALKNKFNKILKEL